MLTSLLKIFKGKYVTSNIVEGKHTQIRGHGLLRKQQDPIYQHQEFIFPAYIAEHEHLPQTTLHGKYLCNYLTKPKKREFKSYDLWSNGCLAKSNRIIVGLDINLKEYTLKVLKKTDFTKVKIQSSNKIHKRFIYTTILPLSNLGDVKISFIKNKLNGSVKLFIVSNDLKISESEIIKIYKERWYIETDYRNNKLYLGLLDFHIKKKEGILRYFTLCFFVSTYL